jgi:hypothetical protein
MTVVHTATAADEVVGKLHAVVAGRVIVPGTADYDPGAHRLLRVMTTPPRVGC